MRVRTSEGRMSVHQALGKLRVLLAQDPYTVVAHRAYDFVSELMRNLQGPHQREAVNAVLMAARIRPKYFADWPYDLLLQEASVLRERFDQKKCRDELRRFALSRPRMRGYMLEHLSAPLPRTAEFPVQVRSEQVKAVLYNSGKHVFMSNCRRGKLIFMAYRQFCGDGDFAQGLYFQHRGHLYGVNGGEAWVKVSDGLTVWELHLQPGYRYLIVDLGNGVQALFKSRHVERWAAQF